MNTSAASTSSLSLNGNLNGIDSSERYTPSVDDAPSSSHAANGYPPPPSLHIQDQAIVNHLYQSGFQTGNYADTIVHVHQNAYRLHAIILSRSPYLVHLMSTSLQTNAPRTIYINLERDPEVTEDGIAIALGYLYSSVSLRLIRPENARGVLAAGSLLGGMDELCEVAYNVCRQSISVDTLPPWLEFASSIPDDMNPTSAFESYSVRLKEVVFDYLVVSLPAEASREVLLEVYSLVPFEMFKAAVESPAFQIGSDQARFKFAKDCIEMRRKGIARGTGAEETVVLAFGGGTGSAVHVTRKMKKRALWKVSS